MHRSRLVCCWGLIFSTTLIAKSWPLSNHRFARRSSSLTTRMRWRSPAFWEQRFFGSICSQLQLWGGCQIVSRGGSLSVLLLFFGVWLAVRRALPQRIQRSSPPESSLVSVKADTGQLLPRSWLICSHCKRAVGSWRSFLPQFRWEARWVMFLAVGSANISDGAGHSISSLLPVYCSGF